MSMSTSTSSVQSTEAREEEESSTAISTDMVRPINRGADCGEARLGRAARPLRLKACRTDLRALRNALRLRRWMVRLFLKACWPWKALTVMGRWRMANRCRNIRRVARLRGSRPGSTAVTRSSCLAACL